MRRIAPLLAGLALALGACSSGGTAAPPEERCAPAGILGEGDLIPLGCSFTDLDGNGVLRLSALRGKPALINFWASWCTFCLREMPAFERVHKDLGDRVTFIGADLVGVDGETEALGRSYAADRGVTYRLIADRDGLLYSHFVLTSRTRTPLLPTTLLVDAQGRVAFRHFGPLEEDQLRDAIRSKLGVAG